MAAQPNADSLQLLASADVILDPFPFGGGNTTYEALATDPDFSQAIRQQIAETSPVLYDNQEDVTAWEDFFQSLTNDQ